jgi:23S rRNA pseudouridine2605 synthase
MTDVNKGERIAKRMARAGLCSRRDAEKWIAEGRVRVNGEKLKSPAFTVTDTDEIIVDNKVLRQADQAKLYIYHKPEGLVTTARDELGRPTVFGALPPEMGRVVSVGRLDLNTEGLLLLTNDGGLARFMELPTTGWRRKYKVRVLGKVDEGKLQALEKGITIDGFHYKSIEAVLENQAGANAWLNVVLTEGKNREVRRVMEALGLKVNRLIRVAYGPFQLGDLPKGAVIEVKQKVLHDQLGGYFKKKN